MPEVCRETNGEKEREVEERAPQSSGGGGGGVAYIKCATPSPPMSQSGASMP